MFLLGIWIDKDRHRLIEVNDCQVIRKNDPPFTLVLFNGLNNPSF